MNEEPWLVYFSPLLGFYNIDASPRGYLLSWAVGTENGILEDSFRITTGYCKPTASGGYALVLANSLKGSMQAKLLFL